MIINPGPAPGSRRTLPRFLVSAAGRRKKASRKRARASIDDARICMSLLLHRWGITASIAAFALQ